MTLEDIRKFEKGNTTYFECYYRSMTSELADPTDPIYRIYDIKANVVASGVPSKKSTGLYYVYWTPTSAGDYVIEFTGKINTHEVKFREKFKVKETSWKGEFSSSSSSSSSSCSSSSCSSSSSKSSSSSSSSSLSSSSSSFSSSSWSSASSSSSSG